MLNNQKLKNLRKEKSLKQIEVAQALNIERTTYVRYENGEIQPPSDMIVKIADIFNTTTDYLLNKTDNPAPLNKQEFSNEEIEETEEMLVAMLKRLGWIDESLSLSEKNAEKLKKAIQAVSDMLEKENEK